MPRPVRPPECAQTLPSALHGAPHFQLFYWPFLMPFDQARGYPRFGSLRNIILPVADARLSSCTIHNGLLLFVRHANICIIYPAITIIQYSTIDDQE